MAFVYRIRFKIQMTNTGPMKHGTYTVYAVLVHAVCMLFRSIDDINSIIVYAVMHIWFWFEFKWSRKIYINFGYSCCYWWCWCFGCCTAANSSIIPMCFSVPAIRYHSLATSRSSLLSSLILLITQFRNPFDQSIWLNGSIYHIEFIAYAHIVKYN